MCERTYCRHEHERLCSCPPVTCRDALGMAAHLAENMEQVQWSLTYNSLKDIKPYQLCLVGKCRICGGRLCMEQRPVEADSTDGFLAAVYRHLYHFHRSIGQCLPRAAFRTKFVEMFRKEDRAAVEDWLSMPENQSIHAMICGNAKRVYTIVHSWADADQGNFPAPEGMAAFTVKEEARKELARLVTEEKENRTIPFPTEEYCEEYGEDETESVSQFFHILGSVEQVRGCCEVAPGQYEITIYTSCCNATRGIYYYTTYGNPQITAVDMHRTDLQGSTLTHYPLLPLEIKQQN